MNSILWLLCVNHLHFHCPTVRNILYSNSNYYRKKNYSNYYYRKFSSYMLVLFGVINLHGPEIAFTQLELFALIKNVNWFFLTGKMLIDVYPRSQLSKIIIIKKIEDPHFNYFIKHHYHLTNHPKNVRPWICCTNPIDK
jgi:hypothetical protein